jgi:type VII secretion protein EccB
MVGSELPSGTALGDDEAVLVEVNGGADGRYLIWQGHRLRVPDRITLAALNLAAVTALPVDNTLINGVPAGPDLTVPAIPQMGANSNKLIFGKPAQIGKVYKNGKQYYVLLSDGLAPIGEVTADLLLAGGARAQDISSATAGKATGNGNVEPAGMPHTVPTVRQARTGTTICAAYRAGADPTAQRVTVSTYDQIPQPLTQNEQGSVSAPRPSVDGVQTADRILVPGGRGALVRVLPAPGVTATTTAYLVTDQGIKYPLSKSGGDAQAFLGYADVTPTPIDASLLALVPTGPALDAAAARNFNVNVGPSTTPGPTKPATGG